MAIKKEKVARSLKLRADLRMAIIERIGVLEMPRKKVAKLTGLSVAQISRIHNDYDSFSLDRLTDAAGKLGLRIELRAVRPWTKKE